MPKEGIGIWFTIKDGASSALASIGDKTKALDKDTQRLAQATAALNKHSKGLVAEQVKLKHQIAEASKKVKEAQKAHNDLNNEMSEVNLDKAISAQAELAKQLISVNTQLNANKKTYREYVEEIRKGSLSSGISDTKKSGGSLFSQLAEAGITKMVGDSLSTALGAGVESGLGQPLASAVSSIASGAVSGFALGGPAGALLGGAAGLVSGMTQIGEAKDSAFKEYYAGLYEDVNAGTEEMISSGSAIAGSREQTRMAFAQRLGSDDAADAYLERVKTMAAGTNYGFDEITGYSKLLLNSYDPEEVFSVLQSLSDATAGLSLSGGDVEMMISGLSRMRTTGKATQEYLNFFSERGVDVYSALGNALGVDKSEVAGMVSKGQVGGEFAAQAILDHIDDTYGGLSEDLMSTYDAMTANLEDIMSNLAAAGGEGYNEMRTSGLEAETEAFSGALGDAMEEINRIAGENKAYLENLSGQYQREALAAVLMGQETTLFSAEDQAKLAEMSAAFQQASEEYESGSQEAGLRMEALKEEAEALAIVAYESSEQYQALLDTQLDQIGAIRENTAGLAAATNAYRLGQELSKGAASTWGLGTGLSRYFQRPDERVRAAMETGDHDAIALYAGHAYGLDRVPYDGYPALLHEGERVLTAAEARAQDAGRGIVIQVTVTGNTIAGAGEDLADQVAEIIVRKVEEAAVLAIPR